MTQETSECPDILGLRYSARAVLSRNWLAPLALLFALSLLFGIGASAQPASSGNTWDIEVRPPIQESPQTVPNSPTLIKSLGDAAELAARWTPPATAAIWRARRPQVEQLFRHALGLESLPERTPLNARIVAKNAFGDFTIENLMFESRPGFPVTANLYRPTGAGPKRRPAVLCPIGHFLTPGKTAPEVQARCIGLVKRGFIVLIYDAIGQGERMTPGNIHHDAGQALLPLGETIAGWMVWDSMRAIDYLQSRDDVDGDSIGMTGNSGGGLNTLFTAALDKRVRAAAIAGFTFEFGNWVKYGGAHCTCTHLPGILRDMNWFEIAGLIAPRAALLLQGDNDGIFPISGARRSAEDTARIYQVMGHGDRMRLAELTGHPHAYSRPFRELMYVWMDGAAPAAPRSWRRLRGGRHSNVAGGRCAPALRPRACLDSPRAHRD